MGKTGTCSQGPQGRTHLGWFGSFNESGPRKLVVVVLLTGGRQLSLKLKKGGLCKLTVSRLNFARCATLEWLLTPRQLIGE